MTFCLTNSGQKLAAVALSRLLNKGIPPLRHKDTKLHQVSEWALCSFVSLCPGGDRFVFPQPW